MFMKYVSSYYASQKKHNYSDSNMNSLARYIERFEKELMNNTKKMKSYDGKPFDYKIMTKEGITYDQKLLEEIDDLFIEFNKKMTTLKKENYMAKNYDKYKEYFPHMSKYELSESQINWKYYYEKYQKKLFKITDKYYVINYDEIASYLVEICYGRHPKKSKSFAWALMPEGLLSNIKQQDLKLPVRDLNGDHEYLGRRYSMVEVGKADFEC